ncbi:ribonuclease H-like domain-containing protein [Colletotrichum acutatum]|uniref:Ribonuclease H-like domain-containing protein n=1 Tax=Glomerella acutata TaxID=27357 RepID=A0AAD8XGE5_GLOAC|nr:ribonuclease H-like domain-containing protein [Colletotrichum acutatum]KAK1726989.1 ribonuclease H-like domain-containing protein [Colletotrichum acutatum]
MEVSSENFWRQLPKILLSIAKSRYIAIDVEMTGIMDKGSENRHDNLTNQQTYESAKNIASKFNVFELGITCVEKLSADGTYKTETYSFTVSPYLHTETRADETFVKGLDRSLSVSYNTLKFLRSEGIRLEKIFEDCVPYLSREEARLATRQMERRQEPWDARDHGYNEHDECLTTFSIYAHNTIVRELVPQMGCRLWNHGTTVIISQRDDGQEAKRRESLEDDLNASLSKYTGIRLIIEALVGGKFADLINPDLIVEAMSGWPGEAHAFCREVHDFIHPTSSEQSEGPSEGEVADRYCHLCCTSHDPGTGCLSTGRPGTDSSPLHNVRSQTTDTQGAHSASHSGGSSSSLEGVADGEGEKGDTGTRHIMAGTSSWYDSWYEPTFRDDLCQDLEELSTETLKNEVADALKELEDFVRRYEPIIIGHNQFMDLLFLYNTFIDDLPDTLDEFRVKIHKLFPFIIDTKLLAINDDTIEGEDPLMDLYNRFDGNRTQPSIHWDAAYGYGRRGTAHQAGFDSHMTAAVFLRIAYKLAREELARLEGRGVSYESKVKRLYDREWLSAVGYDSQFLGYPQDFHVNTRRDYNAREEHVGRLSWRMKIFDGIRNRVRIAPRKTIHVGRDY